MAYKAERNPFANPAVARVNDFEDAFMAQETASYRGVYAKVGYFLAVVLLGVAAFFYMHSYFASQGYSGTEVAQGFVIYANETMIMIGAWLITIVSGLVAAFAVGTIPVTGTIYCAGMGYCISITSFIYAAQYSGIVVEALVLTVLIIAAMAFLYYSGIVKVGERFRTVVLTALIASVLGGVIFTVLYMIAPNSAVVSSILKVQNGPVGILLAVLGVVLGACLLLVDFETISEAVENRVNKKYEWYCGYSLMLSVIYLYLRVLRLLAKLQDSKR